MEREQRRSLPLALVTMLAVVLTIGTIVLLGANTGADTEAESLRKIDDNANLVMVANLVRALGLALLAFPLAYLFRAADARNPGMRSQLIGVVVAAPLFLAALAVVSGFSATDAAAEFVSRGIEGTGDRANELAERITEEQGLRSLASGLFLAGSLGFAIGMTYTCLNAMRVGLLTRFWGSLGMALGVASFFLFQFTVIWFIYAGLLFAGWVPGGRPPAWERGVAVPWPAPGEQLLDEGDGDDEEAAEGGAAGLGARAEAANPPRGRGERRKRKRRS